MRCTKCGEVFVLGSAGETAPAAAPSPAATAASARQREPQPAAADLPRVLVATDGEEFHALVGETLTAAGYELRPVRDGAEAWETIGAWRPHVALLDVALPAVPAFELCDRVRSDASLAGTGLILIASVFQQTRYKRAPTSLYGADDYIEKHHIRDWLPGKIARLLPEGAAAPAPAPEPAPARPRPGAAAAAAQERLDERERRTLIREEQYGARVEARQSAGRLRENLRRYARIIVSDIALYNEELVARGIREGSFYQLLKKELEEGHRLYLTRVPASSPPATEGYWEEAVRDFVARRSGGGDRGDA